MEIFGASELAFNKSFFAKTYPKTLKIQDAHIQDFASSEVPQSSGSFNYPSTMQGFDGRFILWRTDGPNLYLDEYSTSTDLRDASLCINFSQSNVIPSVKAFVKAGMFVLVVPTQSSIHRIVVSIDQRDDVTLGGRSILAYFPRESELQYYWDVHNLKVSGTATQAAITVSDIGKTFISLVMADGPLILVSFPMNAVQDPPMETVLYENGGISRFFSNPVDSNEVSSVAISLVENDVLIFAVYQDNKLRVWSANTKQVVFSAPFSQFIDDPTLARANGVTVKTSVDTDDVIIVLKASMPRGLTNFYFLKLTGKVANPEFELLTSINFESKSVLDYLALGSPKQNELAVVWVIAHEAFDPDRMDSSYQPYSLWRCPIFTIGSYRWERVHSAVDDQSFNELKFAFPKSLNAIKHRIFNGECYSFDVVHRAIQIACRKDPVVPIVYNDWSALVTYVEEYVASGFFIQQYLEKDEDVSLNMFSYVSSTAQVAASERFYETLLRYCDEFQEAGLAPLGLWYSRSLDLVGVIQACRFTVYTRGDTQMMAIVGSVQNQEAGVSRAFAIADEYVDNQVGRIRNDFDVLSDITLELCEVIRLFAEHCPMDGVKMASAGTPTIATSFTSGYLSIVLRRRLMRRFKFATLIRNLIQLVNELGFQTEDGISERWNSVTKTHDGTIFQIADNYRKVWSALSYRLTRQDHKLSDDGLHRVTVGQAFFQLGKDLVTKFDVVAALGSNGSDDDEDASSTGSRFRLMSESESPFAILLREVVDGSIISLWPESTSLTLACFLARQGYADALMAYCLENSPFISELEKAFTFYIAVANAIHGDGKQAFAKFTNVIDGIKAHDNSLNIAISQMLNEPVDADAVTKHSTGDYLKIAMDLLRKYHHVDYALKMGKIIIDSGNCEGDAAFFALVYTDLFKLHLNNEEYTEAVQMVGNNPGKHEREMCLRELVSVMLRKKRYPALANLEFGELTELVAEILERNCQATYVSWDDPIINVAYSFYVKKYMYDLAARVYIEYAIRLSKESETRAVIEKRCHVLAAILGLMQCVPTVTYELKEAAPKEGESQLNRSDFVVVIRQHPNDAITGTLIDKQWLRIEHVKASLRKELINQYPVFAIPPTDTEELYKDALKYRMYDLAFTLCQKCKLDVSPLIEQITYEAIVVDHEEQEVRNEIDFRLGQMKHKPGMLKIMANKAKSVPLTSQPQWIISNKQFVIHGEEMLMPPHWKLVYSYLKYADSVNPSTVPFRAAARQCIKYHKALPDWLKTAYINRHAADLMFLYIEYDELSSALDVYDASLDNFEKGFKDQLLKTRTDLPYSMFDQVVAHARKRRPASDPIFRRFNEVRARTKEIVNLFESLAAATRLQEEHLRSQHVC
uniref:Nucleoporin_N domain-containing protein n=1 Tax=Panagrellus redivivus TaxID=6233 RepID=A0A7E4VXA4_PANRE